MTPLQFAKEQCANFDEGACKGIGIRDNGSLFSFGRKPKCVLGQSGVRCPYFEECVAPMGCEDPRQREERNEALRVYRLGSNAPKFKHQTGRICRVCKTRELEPRRQLCYICAEQRVRQANRNRVQPTQTSQNAD